MNAVAGNLSSGFQILWYQIESVLGRGGFGITYLARDTNLGQLVAIKEYMPQKFAARSGDSTVQPISTDQQDAFSVGLERFMSEAQMLAKFRHPNIVRVLSVFKHNNTGYMVMEYERGKNLSSVYKRKNKLTQRELENIFYPIIHGLSCVHEKGFIHRDIKPSNIYIRKDGSPVLIDFGSARQVTGPVNKTLTSMFSVGYAPFEQYHHASGKQGPWTDVYALSASIYQGITGERPPESTIRGMAVLHHEPDPYKSLSKLGIESFTPAFLKTVDQALMLPTYDRPQTLDDFLGMLKGDIRCSDRPATPPIDYEPTLNVTEEAITELDKQENNTWEVTCTDQHTGTEAITYTRKDQSQIAHAVTPGEQKLPLHRFKRERLKLPGFVLIAVGIIAIIAVGAISPLDEESSAELRQRQLQVLHEKADKLISDGKYYDRNGAAALDTYQQILAIEPESSVAKNGIKIVAQYYLLQAQQYINSGDLSQAGASIKIVNTIDPAFPGLKSAETRLAEKLSSDKKNRQIALLLNQAEAALEKGFVYDPQKESALFYYQNVLSLDPDNATAKSGLVEILDVLIAGAQSALNNDDLKQAESKLSLAESIDPDKPSIRELRHKINLSSELNDVLTRADTAFANEYYTTPGKNNAYDLYKQALTIAPTSRHAKQQLDKIASYYADKSRGHVRLGNIASAQKNLEILEAFFPGDASISSVKEEIRMKQAQIDALKKAEEKRLQIEALLPVNVNQNQDDSQVVQDIVGLFIEAFESRNMSKLLQVSQLTSQQQSFYSRIFDLYQSLSLKVMPNSFIVSKQNGVARVKFNISNLVNAKGQQVESAANWSKLDIRIVKKEGQWLKIIIGQAVEDN